MAKHVIIAMLENGMPKLVLIAVILIVAIAIVSVSILFLPPQTPAGAGDLPEDAMTREEVYEYIDAEIENCMSTIVMSAPRIDYTCLSYVKDDASMCDSSEDAGSCLMTYYIFKSAGKNVEMCGSIDDATGRAMCSVLFSGDVSGCDEIDDMPKTHRSFDSMTCNAIISNDAGKCDSGSGNYGSCVNGVLKYQAAKSHDPKGCSASIEEDAVDETLMKNQLLCKAFATNDISLCGSTDDVRMGECKKQISYEMLRDDVGACGLIDDTYMQKDCIGKVEALGAE